MPDSCEVFGEALVVHHGRLLLGVLLGDCGALSGGEGLGLGSSGLLDLLGDVVGVNDESSALNH